MTHGNQEATSNMMVEMNGEGSSAQIVSRSVAKAAPGRYFTQEQSVKISAMLMYNAILLSWITQKSALFGD